jgi:hypothetical protein
MNCLNELPYEIKMEVMKKCRLKDYENLRCINKSWYSVSNEKKVLHTVLWNEILYRNYYDDWEQ